jgi:hypothetical protein
MYDEIRMAGAANANDPACTPWLRGRVPTCPSVETLAELQVTFNNTDKPTAARVRLNGTATEFNRELHVAPRLLNAGNGTVYLAGESRVSPRNPRSIQGRGPSV